MLATIGGAIGAVIGALLMIALLRTVRTRARQVGSRFGLEYGTPMRVLGIAALLLGGFFLYAASQSSGDQRTLAWCVSGVAAACGVYLFLEVFFVRVEFDDSFIYPFSPWRGSRRIPWSDVTSCLYSELNRWYVIRTRTHGVLRASAFLSGIDSLCERLHETEDA